MNENMGTPIFSRLHGLNIDTTALLVINSVRSARDLTDNATQHDVRAFKYCNGIVSEIDEIEGALDALRVAADGSSQLTFEQAAIEVHREVGDLLYSVAGLLACHQLRRGNYGEALQLQMYETVWRKYFAEPTGPQEDPRESIISMFSMAAAIAGGLNKLAFGAGDRREIDVKSYADAIYANSLDIVEVVASLMRAIRLNRMHTLPIAFDKIVCRRVTPSLADAEFVYIGSAA